MRVHVYLKFGSPEEGIRRGIVKTCEALADMGHNSQCTPHGSNASGEDIFLLWY